MTGRRRRCARATAPSDRRSHAGTGGHQPSDGEIVYANAIAGPLVDLSTEALLGRKITAFYCDGAIQGELLRLLAEQGEVDHREVEFHNGRSRSKRPSSPMCATISGSIKSTTTSRWSS
jgi:hypothetical protein